MSLPVSSYLWVKIVSPSELCFLVFPLPHGKQGEKTEKRLQLIGPSPNGIIYTVSI